MTTPPDGTYPTATHWGSYLATVRDGAVRSLRPAPDDPLPSPIGPGMPEALRDRARITRPYAREGWLKHGPGDTRRGEGHRGADAYVPIGWAEAVDLIARELARVRAEHGNRAIFGGSYGWGSAGRAHHAQSLLHRFLNTIGGYTRSVNTYSSAAFEVVLGRVGGGASVASAATPTWEEIRDHGDLVVAFGGLPPRNVQVNPGGVARHLAVDLQRQCRQAGVSFVVVSPLRDDAPDDIEPEWLAPRPNTDVAVMLGIAHTMVTEGLHDLDFLERCCTGWSRFEAYLLGRDGGPPKDARWAQEISQLSATTITALARRIAGGRSVVTASLSLQRAHHGEHAHWMALTLAAMSGSMGRPGGGYGAGLGSMHRRGLRAAGAPVAAVPQGVNAVGDFIPVARIADMLEYPGAPFDYDGGRYRYPDIRLVYWAGGNPFHHHQDLGRLSAAWQRPETVVVHEHWWNALARRADVVIPVATALERHDIACGRGEQRLSAMHQVADPPEGVWTDYEVLSTLAAALGVGERFTEGRTSADWVRHLYRETAAAAARAGVAMPSFEDFWERGSFDFPRPPPAPNPYALLREDPDAHPLDTPSGRIEIYSETIAGFAYEDCPPHPTWIEPAEWLGGPVARRFPLHLCSGQPATRLHSQYDNGGYSKSRKVQGREPLTLNAGDARARGIRSGDVVRVFNDRGACLAGAVVTDRIRPGVVALATGAWWDPLDAAEARSLDVHGNPNVLTPDIGTSRLAQGPSAHTALVEVERYDAPPPPVRVFEPPPGAGNHDH